MTVVNGELERKLFGASGVPLSGPRRRIVDAWAVQYVRERKESVAGRHGNHPPRMKEARQAVQAAFPVLSLILILYYALQILWIWKHWDRL